MKKSVIATVTILFLAVGSTAFARGKDHRHYRPYYHGHQHHHYYSNDLGIVLGVAGGLLVGSALLNAASPPPPPPAVVYTYPPPPPPQPRVCFEDRVVEGEWQMSRGRQIWVSFPYPVTRRVEVPCY